jgi:hypothetical protein
MAASFFMVPSLCFAVILAFAWVNYAAHAKTAAQG